jgi:antirestriction protein ArdC
MEVTVSTTDKIRQLHEQLLTQVQALIDGDDWRAFLAVATRFHRYSANNIFLILAQAPWATRVAGYRKWQELGRQVRKGEKGISVLAPCRYRAKTEDGAGDEETERAEVVRGFRVVHVFDVSQTDGEPLPCLSAPLLEGDAPAALWDGLAAQVEAAGFELERGDCGEANGRTDFVARVVRVRADVEGAQAAKTLAHELGHVLLHEGTEYSTGCRGRAEVEAESVAYLVCAGVELATDAYSFPYVTMWSGGKPEAVRETAGRVITAARAILDELGLGESQAAA